MYHGITNISVGDLTDASMKDGEVAYYGPTTLLQNGKRYIDLPTMSLIPAYVAEPDGSLSVHGLTAARVGDLAFDHGVRLHELTVVRASLEAAFMELTADSVEYRAGEGPAGQPVPVSEGAI